VPDIALATCSLLPDLDEDERLLIPALASRGLVAEARVWDDPAVAWDAFRLVVIRSTWDYSARRDAFLAWCHQVPRLLNDSAVIAWNTDKTYLRELAAAGIPVVPTIWIAPQDAASFVTPTGHIVVKPAVSSGAQNTSRYGPDDGAQAREHIEGLLSQRRSVMVQPYLHSVDSDGETGLIYIDGAFSHAIRKGALLRAAGVATDQLWAPEDISIREPRAEEFAVAESTMDALPWPRSTVLYARIDLVRGGDGTPQVLELELAEPSLFLGLGIGAAERLAEAIASRIRTN
jgi:glutathione synthase/RimK-type ligase-like ATP-grasp enzyme